jgi:outer membrane protein OmpA-like peptidoglycan-associated protein
MRRLFAAGLLVLALGGCQMEPRDRRFVVFFKPGSVELDAAARGVAAGAAGLALRRPDQPVTIAAYADPEGTPEANAALIRARGQAVFDALVKAGLPPTRIARREVGEVAYQMDAQESRRAVVTIGGR